MREDPLCRLVCLEIIYCDSVMPYVIKDFAVWYRWLVVTIRYQAIILNNIDAQFYLQQENNVKFE